MDYSQLSDSDLIALANKDYNSLSDSALVMLANEPKEEKSKIGSFLGGTLKSMAGGLTELGIFDKEEYGKIAEDLKQYEKDNPISSGLGQSMPILGGAAMGGIGTGALAAGSALLPALGAGLGAGASASLSDRARLIQEGVDPSVADTSALITGGVNALGVAIPGGMGAGLLTKLATGAGVNVGLGIGERGVQNEVLSEYPNQQREIFDPTAMGLDAAFGALAGGVTHMATPRAVDASTRGEAPRGDTSVPSEGRSPPVEAPRDLPEDFMSKAKETAYERLVTKEKQLQDDIKSTEEIINSPRSKEELESATLVRSKLEEELNSVGSNIKTLSEELGYNKAAQATESVEPTVTSTVDITAPSRVQEPIEAVQEPVFNTTPEFMIKDVTEGNLTIDQAREQLRAFTNVDNRFELEAKLNELEDLSVDTILSTKDRSFQDPIDLTVSRKDITATQKLEHIASTLGGKSFKITLASGKLDSLFNSMPGTNIKTVKSLPQEQFVDIREYANKLGLSKEEIYVINSSGKHGKYSTIGNKAIISFSPEKIKETISRLSKELPEVNEKLLGLPEKARTELATKIVIAHEFGHLALIKSFQTAWITGHHLKGMIKQFEKWMTDQGTKLAAQEAAGPSIWDIQRIENEKNSNGSVLGEDATYWQKFDEFYAQRVAKELVFKGAYNKYYSIFDRIVEKFPFFKKTMFIDNQIRYLIASNSQFLKAQGQHLFEYMKSQEQPKMTVEEAAKTLREMSGHGKGTGDGAITAPVTLSQAMNQPGKDIGWFSTKLLANGFGKQQFSGIFFDSPLLQATYTIIRGAEQRATQIKHKLWLGDVSFNGKITLARIQTDDSPATMVSRATDLDMYYIHDIVEKGYKDNITRQEAIIKYGSNLNQKQIDLFNTLDKLWDRQHQETVKVQTSLNKNKIVPYRKGWYPSVRLGDYFIELEVAGEVIHREHFRSEAEAKIFLDQFNKLNNKQGVTSTAIQTKEKNTDFDRAKDFADMISRELDQQGIVGGKQVVEALLQRLVSKGGTLGKHHVFRHNLSGYKGSQLFKSKEELGREFKNAIHSSIEEYAASLGKMIINAKLAPIIENPGALVDSHPNTLKAINLMNDIAINKVQVLTEPVDTKIRNFFDDMASKAGKALGKDNYIPEVSTFDRLHGVTTSFFYIKTLMTRPSFWLGQVLTSPTSIRLLLRDDNVFNSMASAGAGTMRILNPDLEFKKAVFWTSQNTDTFHPQFTNDINKLPGWGASNREFLTKTIDMVTGATPSTAADSFSRYWTFSMMYSHYSKQGLKGKALWMKAAEGTDATMINYGRSNKAPIFQKMGILGEMVSPLQTFGQAQLGNLISDFRFFAKQPGFNSAMPMVATFLTTMLLGGVIGMPLVAEYEAIRMIAKSKGFDGMPSVLEWAIRGDNRLVSHGLLSETGFDMGTGLRSNPILGGILTGQQSALDYFPAVSFGTDLASGFATATKNLVADVPQADVRNAWKNITPGGYFGVVDDAVFDATSRKYVPNTKGAAARPQTTEERAASYLGTGTMDKATESLRMRIKKQDSELVQKRISKQVDIFSDGVQSKDAAKQQRAIDRLITLMKEEKYTPNEIKTKIITEMKQRNIPEYELAKYGMSMGMGSSKMRTYLQYKDLEE